jgi:hypothetical protein
LVFLLLMSFAGFGGVRRGSFAASLVCARLHAQKQPITKAARRMPHFVFNDT